MELILTLSAGKKELVIREVSLMEAAVVPSKILSSASKPETSI